MKASILDLRRRTKDILRALDRNESVTIFHRGKKKGVLVPKTEREAETRSIMEHPAFGMWKDREDMQDVGKYVRKLRRGRFLGL